MAGAIKGSASDSLEFVCPTPFVFNEQVRKGHDKQTFNEDNI